MIAGLNVDPSWAGGRVDPVYLERLGVQWVRLVSRNLEELHGYREACHEIGIRVLAVIARESEGYLLPDCDMYQIGNEPDQHGPSSWTRSVAEYIEDWRIYRETYPGLSMIAAGFASGNIRYFQDVAPHLFDCAGYGVHPYAKNPTEAYSLLQSYRSVRPDLALWVTEWNRGTDQVVQFHRMLKTACDAGFWFCALDGMVAGMGLIGTPSEQLWKASV